jgi:hypothetical protein
MIEDNTGSLFDVSVDSSSLQETRINRANKGNNK